MQQMTKFVLRYTGPGEKPASDVKFVSRQSALKVLDESARMLLVDSDHATIDLLQRNLPHWRIMTETSYAIPKPFTIKRPTD